MLEPDLGHPLPPRASLLPPREEVTPGTHTDLVPHSPPPRVPGPGGADLRRTGRGSCAPPLGRGQARRGGSPGPRTPRRGAEGGPSPGGSRAGPSRGWAAGGARRLLLGGQGLVSERSRGRRQRRESGARWETKRRTGGEAGAGRLPQQVSPRVPALAQALRLPGRRSPAPGGGAGTGRPHAVRLQDDAGESRAGRAARARRGAAGGARGAAPGARKVGAGQREGKWILRTWRGAGGRPSFPPAFPACLPPSARRGLRCGRAGASPPPPGFFFFFSSPLLSAFPFLPFSRRDQLVRRARWSRARAGEGGGGAAGPR